MSTVKTYTLTDTVFGHRTDRSVTIAKHGGYEVKRGMIAGFFLAVLESQIDPGDEPLTSSEMDEIAFMSARMATSMQHGDVVELRKDAKLLDLALDVTYI